MQNALKSNEWRRIWVLKTFKFEIQKGGPNNSDFLQNWFPPEIRSPPLEFVEISRLWERYSWIIQNGLKSNEWQRIWVHKTFKIEIKKGGPNNSDFLQNWVSKKIRSPVFNMQIFPDFEKITPQSCRAHWNLMNDKEFSCRKLSKLKYRMGDQIIQTFCKIGSPQKLGTPSLICWNLENLRKVLQNYAKWRRIWV